MKIGDKIRQIRKANKMTLTELALRVDSDVGNLSRLERGMQGYSDSLIHKIAEALSVPVSELFSSNEANDTVDSYSIGSIIKRGEKMCTGLMFLMFQQAPEMVHPRRMSLKS